jgi:hypothetical protein
VMTELAPESLSKQSSQHEQERSRPAGVVFCTAGVGYRAPEVGVDMLTFPEARPITGWMRGTGRRRYNIDNGSVDLAPDWREGDSGIDFPGCRVQG